MLHDEDSKDVAFHNKHMGEVKKKEAVSKRQPFLCRDCNSPCSFEQTVTDENADGIVFNFDIYKCDKCGQKWSD